MASNPSNTTQKIITIILASLSGILSAAVVGGGAMLLATLSADSLGISPIEGGQGYFAFAIGIVAAPIAFIIGAGTTAYFRGFRRGSIVLGILGSGLLFILLSAAALVAWYSFQPHVLVSNGPPPKLNFEINLPPNAGQHL